MIFRSLLVCCGCASAASVGVGYDQTLVGVKGLSLKYSFADRYLIQAVGDVIGFGNKAEAFSVAGRAMYKAMDRHSLGFYFGVGLGMTNNLSGYDLHATDQRLRDSLLLLNESERDYAYPVAAEIPLMINLRVLPSLSLNMSFGARFGLNYDTEWGYRGSFTGTTGLSFWYDFGGGSKSETMF